MATREPGREGHEVLGSGKISEVKTSRIFRLADDIGLKVGQEWVTS